MRGLKRILAAGFAAAALSAAAADIVTTKGEVYRDVVVLKALPDGLSVKHRDGTAKLLFWDLPKEIQEKYGFDPEKAKAYRQQVLEERKANWKSLRQDKEEVRDSRERIRERRREERRKH